VVSKQKLGCKSNTSQCYSLGPLPLWSISQCLRIQCTVLGKEITVIWTRLTYMGSQWHRRVGMIQWLSACVSCGCICTSGCVQSSSQQSHIHTVSLSPSILNHTHSHTCIPLPNIAPAIFKWKWLSRWWYGWWPPKWWWIGNCLIMTIRQSPTPIVLVARSGCYHTAITIWQQFWGLITLCTMQWKLFKWSITVWMELKLTTGGRYNVSESSVPSTSSMI